jgi:Flp pilus assembly protein TadG
MRGSQQNQKGQAMLESALIMIIFLPIVIGIMDFGQFLYFHQSLTERVRVAARYGAVTTFDATKIVNMAIYNTPDGSQGGVNKALLPYLNATAETDGAVTATLSDSGTDDARVRVTITNFPYNFLIIPGGLKKRTITDTEPYEIGR